MAKNQHIFKVLFDEAAFDKRFLQLAINQNLNEYIGAAHGGAGLAHITKGKFEQSELVKPPFNEQLSIVAEIEKQFSRLDEAVASLKRVKANLKRYKAAVEGKLTEDWRKQHPNVEPTSKLLERILAERHKKWNRNGTYREPVVPDTDRLPSLPDGWVWTRLDTIAALKGGITVDKNRKSSTARSVPYLRVANVQRGYLDLSELKVIEAPEADIKDLCLVAGDILLALRGNEWVN